MLLHKTIRISVFVAPVKVPVCVSPLLHRLVCTDQSTTRVGTTDVDYKPWRRLYCTIGIASYVHKDQVQLTARKRLLQVGTWSGHRRDYPSSSGVGTKGSCVWSRASDSP